MSDEDEVMVTVADVAACKFCYSGTRAWCKRNGVNWLDFLNGGVPASVMNATNDALAARVVEAARKRLGKV